MRIEQVRVTAFGPLRDAVLDLAPSMTVVVGANESAKSSWHAATYAALCGIRRGRGQPNERDRVFRSRHEPWGGGPWRAGARVLLDDGRRIEISQELADRVDCRAVEVPIGRDVSGEILNEGVVDASMWLGLGRRGFEATACVRQADLLAVRQAAGDLGELLGRAAAAGGADESATRAIGRISAFQRDAVGSDRSNAVGPWRRALDAAERAERQLREGREARAAFDVRAAEAEQAERRARRRAEQAALARAVALAALAVEREQAAEAALAALVEADTPGSDGRPGMDPGQAGLGSLQAALDALTQPGAVEAEKVRRQGSVGWPGVLAGLGFFAVIGGLLAGRPWAAIVGGAVALVGAGLWFARRRRASRAEGDGVDAQVRAARRATLEARLETARLQQRHAEAERAEQAARADRLRRAAVAARIDADAAAQGLSATTIATMLPLSADDLADLQADARDLELAAERANAALAEAARSLPDVAGLEEVLAAARAQVARVEDLREVLDLTEQFMRRAQDRVHRDLAPRLRESVVRWLPQVTDGRYVDVTVDPQTLAVQVCGDSGQWRDAGLVSYGTAEQIHLLLRLALVEHLSAGHDTCPLLLDDVTVHADARRTREILDLLRAVSAERQVVLFTQEDAVAQWAREHLPVVAGRVVDLPVVPNP